MEKDTVILSLKDYNNLRDFETAIKNKDAVQIVVETGYSNYHADYSYILYTESTAIKKVADINQQLIEEIKELKFPKIPKPKLYDISKMSIWKFIKLRRT